MLHTTTVRGYFLQFQFTYSALTFSTVLSKILRHNPQPLRKKIGDMLDHEFVIKNRIGCFSVTAKNDSLTKSITSFEYHHHHWLEEHTGRGVFLDIGANIGFYSHLAIKKYGFKKALAFEPNPETFNRLKRNIALNKLESEIFAHNIGVGAQPSKKSLFVNNYHTGASTLTKKVADTSDTIAVQIVALDTYLPLHTTQPDMVDFIKIDIEGYEYPALQGMQYVLQHVSIGTPLFIEIHPSSVNSHKSHALIQRLGFSLIKQTTQKNFLYQKSLIA